eukprot:gnl/TRDRNA2_/TRDRNA2_190501_c0_seq1.p1 gnl/TRDRNA2_/TRDRNA2_190501_c0~~gnl/TRDRNA2_/TRDRNA2_190501_c0_seq1.p1  ORF type:complete len:247 (-),score=66.97 gnl/TRDRNA2_/TRDRNA2_190501_c0_seq1:136-876(-)
MAYSYTRLALILAALTTFAFLAVTESKRMRGQAVQPASAVEEASPEVLRTKKCIGGDCAQERKIPAIRMEKEEHEKSPVQWTSSRRAEPEVHLFEHEEEDAPAVEEVKVAASRRAEPEVHLTEEEQPQPEDDDEEEDRLMPTRAAMSRRAEPEVELVFEHEVCKCDATFEEGSDICTCSGNCSDREKRTQCETLIGQCSCLRSEQATCECNGYCHTKNHRKRACEVEPGCEWKGMWCEAQIGLVWD